MGVNFFGARYVTSTYENLDNLLSDSLKLMETGNCDKAKEQAEKAEKLFAKREPMLSAFVNHGILDDIGTDLASVAPLANEDSQPEFKSNCNAAKISLRHMRNDHIFMLGNLF